MTPLAITIIAVALLLGLLFFGIPAICAGLQASQNTRRQQTEAQQKYVVVKYTSKRK